MNGRPFCIHQIFLVIAWREDGRLAIVGVPGEFCASEGRKKLA
jgi:hypothetical protein